MTADYPMLPLAIGAAAAYLAATFAGSLMVRRGFPIPGGKNRIGCIDGLRGYLAISVLIHHFIIWTQITRLGGTWAAPSVNAFNHLGAGGVALFFMTTGLVFYPRILTGFVATSWLATYTTRIFRIMPLVFFSLLVIIAIIYLRHGYTTGSPFIISAARWLTSWGEPDLLGYADSGRLNAYVLWSLWYEWVFYFVVLPLCAVGMDLIRGRAPSWALPVAFLLTALAARLFA